VIIIDITIIVLLLILAYQDFRYRAVSWILLVLAVVPLVINAAGTLHYKDIIFNFLINAGFVVIQFLSVTLYFSLKNRSLTNIFNRYIGTGDVIMFMIMCIAFSPVNFIVFTTLGLFLLTIIYGINYIIYKTNKLIPLAGCMSLILICLFIVKITAGVDFYDDNLIVGGWMIG